MSIRSASFLPIRRAALSWAIAAGDFYIICPDNEVTRDIDNRRILWAAEDIIRNRPALSRRHPNYTEEFAEFLTLDAPFRR